MKQMELKEIDSQSELVKRALKDGVETVAEYAHWLSGYQEGVRETTQRALYGVREPKAESPIGSNPFMEVI